MGKTVWIIVGVIIVLIIAGYFLFSGNDTVDQKASGGSGNQPTVDQATAQVIDESIVAEDDDVELGEVIE